MRTSVFADETIQMVGDQREFLADALHGMDRGHKCPRVDNSCSTVDVDEVSSELALGRDELSQHTV